MRCFSILHQGQVVPVRAANVDTDTLIPKQYLKRVERAGLADYLFDPWRYADEGHSADPYIDCRTRVPKAEFALNQPRYRDASILLAGANFGCGSSREQAPWALCEWGIRALIAPSFGDIFYNNCLANGLLPIVLTMQEVNDLFDQARNAPLRLTIDLPRQEIHAANDVVYPFEISAFSKNALIQGSDAIEMSLCHAAAIDAFEQARFQREPWLRNNVPTFNAPSPTSDESRTP